MCARVAGQQNAAPPWCRSEKHGEVDHQQDAEAEAEGVGLEVAGLGLGEEPARAVGEAGEAADEEAVDDQIVEEMHDGSESVLEIFHEAFLVDRVEVEAVAEQRDGERVFRLAVVEDETGGETENQRGDGGDQDKGVPFGVSVLMDGADGVERSGKEGEAGEDRHPREGDERDQHQRADLVGVVRVFGAGLAEERDHEGAGHVEGGQESDEDSDGEECLVAVVGGGEDFLLGPETGGDVRHGDEGGGADGEGVAGDGHFFQQTAHFPDVLFVVAGVDDRAGTEEKQRLEPGVGEEVEHARLTDEQADGHHHVSELREGGVGEDFLDVILLGGHQRGHQRGDASDPGDGGSGEAFERLGSDGELHAEQHVNAGRDHGGGVDQGGNGGGAFHRVRQPDMERELCGFPDRAAEHAEKSCAEDASGNRRWDFHFRERQRAGDAPHHQDADHETEVSDAVREEGFLRGVGGRVLLIPMSDE